MYVHADQLPLLLPPAGLADDRPGGIPRPDDDILVLLQTDQPPAAAAHADGSAGAPQEHAGNHSSPSAIALGIAGFAATTAPTTTTADEDQAHAQTRAEHEEQREEKVAAPGDVAQVPAEDGEEAEDFDAEEGEGEDVRGGGEAGGENGGGHERGVCGEGGGESGRL